MQIARFSGITGNTQKIHRNAKFGTDSKPKAGLTTQEGATQNGTSNTLNYAEYLADPNVRNSGKFDYSDYLKSQGLTKTPAYKGNGYGENQKWPGWDWTKPGEE